MKQAGGSGARFAAILGDEELAAGEVTLRDLAAGSEERLPRIEAMQTDRCSRRGRMSYRTHWCGEITEALVGQRVDVAGWVHRRRDHGGLVFIDLRDRTGLVQLVFDPEVDGAAVEGAHALRSEYVLTARGAVLARSPETGQPRPRPRERSR